MKIYPHPKVDNCIVVEKRLTYALIHLPQNEPVVFKDEIVTIGEAVVKFKDKKTSDLFDANGILQIPLGNNKIDFYKHNISIFGSHEN